MDNIFYTGQVIWAQIDANLHLRHSAYADVCAQARSNMLNRTGFSLEIFSRHNIGPILFREELTYLREVRLDEVISVSVEITKYNKSNSRFSFRHIVYKEDGVKAAVVVVDGAWMDISARKLTVIPSEWQVYIDQIPKSDDFVLEEGA